MLFSLVPHLLTTANIERNCTHSHTHTHHTMSSQVVREAARSSQVVREAARRSQRRRDAARRSQRRRDAARRSQRRRDAERHCDHTATTRQKVVSFSEVVECSDETFQPLKYKPELDESYLELKKVAESLNRQLDGGHVGIFFNPVTVWNTLDLQ